MSNFQINGDTQAQNPMQTGFGNILPTTNVGFRIPHGWKRDHTFMDHINWYMTRFGLRMDKATEDDWLALQRLANLKEPNWERELLIHVRPDKKQGTVPLINLTTYSLDAHSSMYDSRNVSGIFLKCNHDFCLNMLVHLPCMQLSKKSRVESWQNLHSCADMQHTEVWEWHAFWQPCSTIRQ